MDEKSFTWIGTPNQQALSALCASIAWHVAQKVEADAQQDGGGRAVVMPAVYQEQVA